MSNWLVDRTSAVLERRTSRRSFLAKSAVVGSALAVSPWNYLLKPGTAYAAICSCAGWGCNCGAACCDGYTEFCCVVHGSNSCPPGTFTGGWWKADGTAFCSPDGSAPRYYIDCSSCYDCGCGCGGSCDNRRTCCNYFRYGQCNQQISCVGYIDCRIVTCTPPWIFDSSCTTTSATDNATAYHDAPCLHPPPPPQWSNYEWLGAPPVGMASGPDVSSWAPGRLDVFTRGGDNALWHAWFEGGWNGWEYLGGGLASDPSAVSWGPGRIDVFVRGTHNALWHNWFEGGWHGWESLGAPPGGMTSSPDAASWGPGRLDVFARGVDGALWHTWYDGAWRAWEYLGGSLTSDPSAVSWGPGHLDVFVRGNDNALWHTWYDGAWRAYEYLGGSLTSGPDAASWGPGRFDVFVRGDDYGLWHQWYDGAWRGYEPLGGSLSADPGAVAWSPGRLDVLVRGGDNNLWHKWWA